jgi:DNA-binding transcriptional MerR regulator
VKIGDLARQTGVKPETIRYYEGEGLLPAPARTAANYRAFGAAHLARLSFIRRSRELGFTLDEVRELLDLADCADRPCHTADALAAAHLQRVERKIADLMLLQAELSRVLSSCSHGTVADCRIIELLSPGTQP